MRAAAVPRELAAAALFGSVRGAFTGAERASPGYFGQAEGGTLFLDEIGDTPAEVQPQLLRALQQREVQVVGGEVRKVDVRVISATDALLEGDDSNFRSALRYRLGAFECNLPPLRDHPQDIGELLLFFLERCAAQSGRGGLLPQARTSAPDIAAWAVLFYTFLEYSWPGNVRELENFANQVVLSSEGTPVISAGMRRFFDMARAEGAGVRPLAGRRKLQEIDDDVFDRAMADNGFEVKRVAAQLRVSRAAVYRRIAASTRYRLANEITPRELREAVQAFGEDVAALAEHFRVPLNSLRNRLRDLELDRR
jgi:two-component system nitrogen regulation response regulator GlnG